jgi:carboxypeptidase Q
MTIYLFILFAFVTASFSQENSNDKIMVKKVFDEVLTNGTSYELLEHLCKKIGHRLSGSENAEKAVFWTKKVMEDYGFDRVFLQEVMVPKWVRGDQEIVKIDGSNEMLSALAIGGSVGTEENGIKADVVMFHNITDLEKADKSDVEGKIVFINGAFNQTYIRTSQAYSETGRQRWQGASVAASLGAVGVIIRSLSSSLDDFPHTGSLGYDEKHKKIPAFALSTIASNKLATKIKMGTVKLFMKLNSKWYDDVKSYNVVGELKGSEKPDEIIVVGGHLDSWDVGEGAHDDGTGCMQSIDVLRTFKALNIKPKRTIRAVMFMNEENGLRGGLKYAELAKENKENHIAAIESDAGGFTPRGFSVDGAADKIEKMQKWVSLFDKNTISYIDAGYGGADISPLNKTQNTVCIGLNPDTQRYFTLHHTNNDVLEQVNKRELLLGTASMASLVYLLDQYGL